MLVGNHLKSLAGKMGKTIYQIKHELLSNYLINELKYPVRKFRVIFSWIIIATAKTLRTLIARHTQWHLISNQNFLGSPV